jgi:acyl-coenzyme A synthetase/AMP-(fatty) acid ligase/acyl carrier protein
VPKGAQITHASLSNLVDWHNRAFSVTSADRASQMAGLGFDATVGETWPYLSAGASLCLADDQTMLSPEHLQSWLVSHQITIGFVPTPLAERIIVLKWPERTRLRALLTGGDTLHVHPIKGLPFTVINNYGPTECGMVTTSGVLPPSDSTTLPSIGAPIDNCQVYILDESMRPAAAGERGELYVGGVNVGRGYCNRPELTRERFLPNPFLPGTTMYKTGDLGCYLPSGEIAFFGRIDNQVKIRGYRIELDEIAAVLNGHPAIAASAVVARGEREERKLIAYIIPSGSPSRAELQECLLKTLPDYMVPATFVVLESLPLTANGKVDTSALPEPTPENMLVDQASSAASEIEASLAQVVANLLHVPEVGPEDDFFLMGGHSLLGTQLIARIRDSFGVNVPLRTLFEEPTVRGLAAEVERLLIERIEAMPEEEARRELRMAESQRTAQRPAA